MGWAGIRFASTEGREVISGAIYPAFKPSARGGTPPNDGLGIEVGCGSGNEEKEQDQMSKSIRTWSMREEGRRRG